MNEKRTAGASVLFFADLLTVGTDMQGTRAFLDRICFM